MAGAGRAVAGVAVAVAAALVLFVAFRGHDGSTGSAGTGSPATGAAGGFRPADIGALAGQIASSPARSWAVPAAVPAPPHANPLSAAASSYAAGRSGSVLAAVYDLRTGQSWRLGDGPAQDEASVVKLDILETLLAARGGAALPTSEKALARSMIEDSDNDAATSLWDKAGGAAGLSAYNDRAGLARTTPSPCVACTGFAWPGWGLSTTVPDDQLTLLRQLVLPGSRPLLSDAARSYALSLMENVARGQRWGVSGGVPAGVTVALKNGWLPLTGANSNWQVNSVGWVSGDGRDYLIAVLTTGNPTEQYGIDTISALSARVWAALGLPGHRAYLVPGLPGTGLAGRCRYVTSPQVRRAGVRDPGTLPGGRRTYTFQIVYVLPEHWPRRRGLEVVSWTRPDSRRPGRLTACGSST